MSELFPPTFEVATLLVETTPAYPSTPGQCRKDKNVRANHEADKTFPDLQSSAGQKMKDMSV